MNRLHEVFVDKLTIDFIFEMYPFRAIRVSIKYGSKIISIIELQSKFKSLKT